MGTLAAIIYPLPYSILFLMITIDVNVPFVAIFMLAGMRSGAIALLLKYCLHFPKQVFHWIVLVFTVLIGVFLPNSTFISYCRLYLLAPVRNQHIPIFLPPNFLAPNLHSLGPPIIARQSDSLLIRPQFQPTINLQIVQSL